MLKRPQGVKLRPERTAAICNLYRLTTPASAIAALFDAAPAIGANYREVVAPTDPGLVIARDQVRAMAWGFPRIETSKVHGIPLKPHAVYNVRTENIGSKFWRTSFARRRCLIPLDAWAEAEGDAGSKTRTWFTLPAEDTFAVAGIWQRSAEWGHVFSMLTVPGIEVLADLNDRMPVILPRDAWRIWADGSPTAAHALCKPWPGELVRKSSSEPWSERKKAQKAPDSARQIPLPL